LNVLYTYDIFSEQKYGGISRYFFEMIKRISTDQATVRVFAGLYINEYIKQLPTKTGINVPQWKNTGFIRRGLSSSLQKLALLGSDDKTIIHQTYYYPFVPPGKSKYVITVYDMIHELFSANFPQRHMESRWKRQCCDRADKIIAISNSTKSDLVNLFGVDPEKIEVIHLASPLDGAASSVEDNRSDEVFDNAFSRPYILYVGLRSGHKNFTGLVQAFSRSRVLQDDFHLLCFGGGPFNESEKGMLKELGVSKLVRYLNGNDALLMACYQEATVFVYPSLYEGFGIPPLEAMSMSCPVICSNTSSIPEVVGDAGVFFDPNDISSIQNALEDTIYNGELLEELKAKGLLRNSLFSWDKCVNKTVALYRSTLS